MPRKIRYIIPQIPHHAFCRGNNRQDIFYDDEDRRNFLLNLATFSKKEDILLGAYCLMANHVHLLCYPQTSIGLIKLMKSLAQLHTQYINRKYKRTGKLWENRYKLNVVDPDYEWGVARYIEKNPVRAGMVTVADNYKYSSAQAHLRMTEDILLTKDIIQNRSNEYREFFDSNEADKSEYITQINIIIDQEKAWGSGKFIKGLEEKFKATFHVRQRGRPAKKEGE